MSVPKKVNGETARYITEELTLGLENFRDAVKAGKVTEGHFKLIAGLIAAGKAQLDSWEMQAADAKEEHARWGGGVV